MRPEWKNLSGVAVLAIIVAVPLLHSCSKTTPQTDKRTRTPQEMLIEKKGLPEFDPENDTANDVTPEDKKLAEEMMPVFKDMGDGKDVAKNKKAVLALGKLIGRYPEYSDLYFLRATVSMLIADKDHSTILADVDNGIKFRPSTKHTGPMDTSASRVRIVRPQN